MDKTDSVYVASLIQATLIVPIQGAKDEKRLKNFLAQANIHYYDVCGDQIISEYKDIYWKQAIEIDRHWLYEEEPSLQFHYTKNMVSVDEV